ERVSADGTAVVGEIGENEKLRLLERKRHLVVDGASHRGFIPFRTSFLAKRSVQFGLSTLGQLKTFAAGSTSSLAALADTAGQIPGTVSSSLAEASKIRTEVDALRDRGIDRQLDQLKKQIDLKNQELTLAGLSATEAQHTELERLKQQAEILQQQK